jgi:hypothetical protein
VLDTVKGCGTFRYRTSKIANLRTGNNVQSDAGLLIQCLDTVKECGTFRYTSKIANLFWVQYIEIRIGSRRYQLWCLTDRRNTTSEKGKNTSSFTQINTGKDINIAGYLAIYFHRYAEIIRSSSGVKPQGIIHVY